MEREKIAVLGCSHTAYDQVFYKIGLRQGNDGKDWVHYASDRFKNLEFHNYACQGHGPLYYDIVLKYILAELPENFYNTVIVQYTVNGRWLHPVHVGDFFADKNIIEEIQLEQKEENYYVGRMHPQRLMSTRHHSYVYGVNRNIEKDVELSKEVGEYMTGLHQPDGIVTMYESSFIKSFNKLYAPHFKNAYWWDFSNSFFTEEVDEKLGGWKNNIDRELPFKEWAIEKYGIEYLAKHLIDDSFHCTEQGNKLLLNEYLMPSLLGKHLETLNAQS